METILPAPPPPHVPPQQVLVRTLGGRAGVQLGVRQHGGPAGVPVVSPGLSVQLGAPAAPHDGDRVIGMVPHRVQTQVGLQPLRHGRGLPLRDPAVEVPGQHDRDLRVQAGQEPPQHREQTGGGPGTYPPRDGLDVTEVEERVTAGQLTETSDEGVARSEVVVQPQHEP